jgi:hypothetical protein
MDWAVKVVGDIRNWFHIHVVRILCALLQWMEPSLEVRVRSVVVESGYIEPSLWQSISSQYFPAPVYTPPPTPISNPLLDTTRELVKELNTVQATGEYKRHVVYAELQKRFPDERHRDLSLAIETVCQEM